MIYEKIFLKDVFEGITTDATLTTYVRSTSPAIEPDRKRASVPFKHSFILANAMKKANIPFELHIYPDGPHGLSLGTRETRSTRTDAINPYVYSWIELCERWLARFIDKNEEA